MRAVRYALALALLTLGAPWASASNLVGHSGPVGTLSARGDAIVSGGMDSRAILWDPDRTEAIAVTRFHDGNVTAVAALGAGRFASAGQDGRVALWQSGEAAPLWSSPPGVAPVSVLSASPDGAHVAAGFWDGTLALFDAGTGTRTTAQAHEGRVAGLGWTAAGDIVSVGADLRFQRYGADLALRTRTGLPDIPNGLAATGSDHFAVIFAEGAVRLFDAEGQVLPERFLTDRPLVSVTADAGSVAVGAIDGHVWILNAATLIESADFAATTGPAWALALTGEALFTAGMDGTIRRWSARDGVPLGDAEAPATVSVDDGSHGARVWRACAVCHSLEPGDHSRAGPSLHGVFGRRVATAPGFDYSTGMRALDIVWSPETVAALFEFGPEAYTPGSRMPEQRLADPADRAALVEFLARFNP